MEAPAAVPAAEHGQVIVMCCTYLSLRVHAERYYLLRLADIMLANGLTAGWV